MQNQLIHVHSSFVSHLFLDFTRLKLVQGKKEDDIPKENNSANDNKKGDEDITAAFDADDDADVVF